LDQCFNTNAQCADMTLGRGHWGGQLHKKTSGGSGLSEDVRLIYTYCAHLLQHLTTLAGSLKGGMCSLTSARGLLNITGIILEDMNWRKFQNALGSDWSNACWDFKLLSMK
jgi:hypothetical protein